MDENYGVVFEEKGGMGIMAHGGELICGARPASPAARPVEPLPLECVPQWVGKVTHLGYA